MEANSFDVIAMYSDIAKANLARLDAQRSIERALPVGTEVTWETRRMNETYLQHGEIVAHGVDGSVKVRNRRTGKESWIGISSAYGFCAAGCWAP